MPRDMSDDHIKGCAGFRSKGRLPSMSWAHPRNGSTMWRCSQPKVGMMTASSAADEYVETYVITRFIR